MSGDWSKAVDVRSAKRATMKARVEMERPSMVRN